jgi:rod shape-determining protein MreC
LFLSLIPDPKLLVLPMPVSPRSQGWSPLAAVPWRLLNQRFSFILFLIAALALLVLGRVQPGLIESARVHVVDGIAPVLDAIARPMAAAEAGFAEAKSYLAVRAENQRLAAANAQLKEWRNTVIALQHENSELRALLHFTAEPGLAYISARVIADTGGPFVRGLIVTAGKLDGVKEGMAAMTGDGLVGRVIEVGDWSSRVLLITDLSSRIPVTIAGSGDRAIMAGDNSSNPRLLYLPADAVLSAGAHVITSGHGGVFPPDLPVGVVAEEGHGAYGVVPLADLGRINYVRLVDFNLKGGDFNPVQTKIEAEQKPAR